MKKIYYCSVCGGCTVAPKDYSGKSVSCNYCKNEMQFKGEYDWENMNDSARRIMKNRWKNEAADKGRLQTEMYKQREERVSKEAVPQSSINSGNYIVPRSEIEGAAAQEQPARQPVQPQPAAQPTLQPTQPAPQPAPQPAQIAPQPAPQPAAQAEGSGYNTVYPPVYMPPQTAAPQAAKPVLQPVPLPTTPLPTTPLPTAPQPDISAADEDEDDDADIRKQRSKWIIIVKLFVWLIFCAAIAVTAVFGYELFSKAADKDAVYVAIFAVVGGALAALLLLSVGMTAAEAAEDLREIKIRLKDRK